MKKFTWKKLMSLVLVAALVIGCLQLNAKRVSAEDGEPAAEAPVLDIVPSAAVGESSAELEPAIVYSVTRTPGQVSETNQIVIALAMDTSGSMGDTIAEEEISEQNWTLWDWGYYFLTGHVPTRHISALEVATIQAKNFAESLGENISVKYVVFNSGANVVSSLDGVTANGGTNIDAALEAVEDLNGVKALVVLTDGLPTFATQGEGGTRIGNGSDTTQNVLDETNAAITRLTKAGVTIYAINYGGAGNIFENQNNEKVIPYSSDFDAASLKAELDKIATSIKEIYATDAYIEAVLGDYVQYVGDAADVTVSTNEETGVTTLKWDIADYNKDVEGSVLNPVTPDLKFAVVVKDAENNVLTEKDDIVARLLELDDPETDDDQIVVENTTDEEGNDLVVIKVAVTAKGQTVLHYFVGTEEKTKAVDCTATEAVSVYSYTPVVEPEEQTYMINYIYGEDVVAVSTGSAVLPYKAVADYANAVANEGFDKADYEVKEGATLEFDLVAGSDNVFAVELVKKAPVVLEVEYKVNYKAGDDLVASYTDSIADGSDIQAKALTDAAVIAAEGFDKTKYEVVAGQTLTFHVTVDFKEFDVEVQLKKVDPKPTDDPGQKIEIIFATPTPTPDPEPTDVPTPTPTEEPTPSQIHVVDIEETETPEGDVDLEETETPQAAPEEEELDVEPIDTPQGDLPQTGVAPTVAFLGLGAACVLFGGMIVLKNRRKEEM